MLSKAAQKLAYFFAEKKIIQQEEKEIYAYGYEILLSEAINWLITIIIAILTKRIGETVVYMLAFMRLRGALGGFHAKSHWGCILISTVVYVFCLFIVSLTPAELFWILTAAGLVLHMLLVFTIAPVAHPNKPFVSEREYKVFRKKSIILSFVYGISCAVLTVMPWEILKTYGCCIVLGMLSASISMAVEYTAQKIQRRCV